MVNESPELKEDQPSLRSAINNLTAGAISLGANPLSSMERHKEVISHLTRPITLMRSDESKTNVLTASYEGGRELLRHYFQFPIELQYKLRKLTEALAELATSGRIRVKQTLEKNTDR